jgi:hypothetical protein
MRAEVRSKRIAVNINKRMMDDLDSLLPLLVDTDCIAAKHATYSATVMETKRQAFILACTPVERLPAVWFGYVA